MSYHHVLPNSRTKTTHRVTVIAHFTTICRCWPVCVDKSTSCLGQLDNRSEYQHEFEIQSVVVNHLETRRNKIERTKNHKSTL